MLTVIPWRRTNPSPPRASPSAGACGLSQCHRVANLHTAWSVRWRLAPGHDTRCVLCLASRGFQPNKCLFLHKNWLLDLYLTHIGAYIHKYIHTGGSSKGIFTRTIWWRKLYELGMWPVQFDHIFFKVFRESRRWRGRHHWHSCDFPSKTYKRLPV